MRIRVADVQEGSSAHGSIRSEEPPRSEAPRQSVVGENATVLSGREPGGTAGAAFAHLRIYRGARMTGCFDKVRLSFNLADGRSSSCEWTTAGKRQRHSPTAGAVYIAPAGMDFEAATDIDTEILAIELPSDAVSLAAGGGGIASGSVIERVAVSDPRLFALARALRAEVEHGAPNGPVYWAEVSDAIALAVADQHVSQPETSRTGVLPDRLVQKVNALIDASIASQIDLEQMANAAGQSRFHFLRSFTKAVGMTPSRYLMHRRARAAIAMVKAGREPFAMVAAATGFADQSHLSRWCKKLYGIRLSDVRSH